MSVIRIKIDKPNKIKPTPLSTMSGYITFTYNADIIEFVKSLGNRVYNPDDRSWEVPMSAIPFICNKLEQYEVIITGPIINEVHPNTTLPVQFNFKTNPYRHQVEGVLFGLEHGSFLLGDDQGLGKTKQIIDLAVVRKNTEGLKHCLIVCGVNGNKYNWRDEIALHSNEKSWILGTRFTKRHPIREREGTGKEKLDDLKKLPDCFFIITNIETLRALSFSEKKGKRNINRYPIAEQIQKLCDENQIGMIALDEAHKVKNPTCNQGEALLQLNPRFAIPMSGTFLMNNPLDLYVPLRWAGFETHSFYQYKMHYCVYGGFGGTEIIGYKNLEELRALMGSGMLRRTKDEVIDLPPKIHTTEYIEVPKAQRDVYEEVSASIKQSIDKVLVSNEPLAQLIRLRQATGYPGLLSTTVTDSAKMDRLVEMVEEIVSVNQKVIVYSQWVAMTQIINAKLSKHKPAYITGEIDTETRMQEVRRFQNDPECKIIIGTVGAMGTGITLNAATNVIFLDEPWNRALKDQAEDRAHRIGTKGTVRVITLVCKSTIDESISNLVQKKGKMADLLIDGKMEKQDRKQLINYLLQY